MTIKYAPLKQQVTLEEVPILQSLKIGTYWKMFHTNSSEVEEFHLNVCNAQINCCLIVCGNESALNNYFTKHY